MAGSESLGAENIGVADANWPEGVGLGVRVKDAVRARARGSGSG